MPVFAFRADTIEVHVVSDELKLVSLILREGEIKAPGNIHDFLTRDTYEMMMGSRISVEPFLVRVDG
jgi:hypothetical protein